MLWNWGVYVGAGVKQGTFTSPGSGLLSSAAAGEARLAEPGPLA